MESAAALVKRQNNDDLSNYDDNYYGGSWWWSDTGIAIRYTIIIVLFALILLYFIGGYLHARRRLKKGLPLKPYHRWMVRRSYRQTQQNAYYQDPNQQGYPMQPYGNQPYGMQPPPPAYNNHAPPPPAYAPPEGASKVIADQNYHGAQFGQPGESSQPAPARQ